MTEPVIRARALTKRYGALTAVDHLELEVAPGEVFGLLGPNGAGKTTTILMLLGLTQPSAGTAEVVGLDPARQPLAVKRRVGYLPDNVGFYDGLTGRENLRYTARLNGLKTGEADERITRLLERVGLAEADEQRVETYSRGMRQRLGIADALIKQPDVAILDEPTAGIDPEGAAEVLAFIRGLAQEDGLAVLLSSHLLYQVQSVCDRVGIFVRGRMIAQGSLAELARELASERQTTEVESDGEAHAVERALRSVSGVDEVRRDDRSGLWLVTSEADVRAALVEAMAAAGLRVLHLRRQAQELDDLYRRYFHASPAEARNGAAV
ncbi:MAG: ABC transporter ATP-binding protein [Actinomycetia bacterium]|nr:ABC transporter ATP-binding protein [Actinomycetes bacterium]